MKRRKVRVLGGIGQKRQVGGAEHGLEVTKADVRAQRFFRPVAGKIDCEIKGERVALVGRRVGEPLPPFNVPAGLGRTGEIDQGGDAGTIGGRMRIQRRIGRELPFRPSRPPLFSPIAIALAPFLFRVFALGPPKIAPPFQFRAELICGKPIPTAVQLL